METWLWDLSQPSAQTASGTIRGYPVSCTLTPTLWTFDVGDDHAEAYDHPRIYTSTSPGEEAATTEVRHFWEVKDSYAMSLAVDWTRRTTAGIDRPTRTTTTDYPVKEVIIGAVDPDQ